MMKINKCKRISINNGNLLLLRQSQTITQCTWINAWDMSQLNTVSSCLIIKKFFSFPPVFSLLLLLLLTLYVSIQPWLWQSTYALHKYHYQSPGSYPHIVWLVVGFVCVTPHNTFNQTVVLSAITPWAVNRAFQRSNIPALIGKQGVYMENMAQIKDKCSSKWGEGLRTVCLHSPQAAGDLKILITA